MILQQFYWPATVTVAAVYSNIWMIELRYNIQPDIKLVIYETLFPASLLALVLTKSILSCIAVICETSIM